MLDRKMDNNFPPSEKFRKGRGNMKSKNEQLNKELKRQENIDKEIKRLKKLYKDFPKAKKDALDGLINESAFMKVMLEEIRIDLLKNEMFEIFEQGSQKFERERPQAKKYETMVPKYASIQKQLIDILPVEEQKKETNELTSFMQKGNSIRCKQRT